MMTRDSHIFQNSQHVYYFGIALFWKVLPETLLRCPVLM